MGIESAFGLNEPPFTITPNPRFLYLTEQVKEAIAKCEYMVANRVGPLYIYGPIGSGKTSILRTVRERLSENDDYVVKSIIASNIRTSNGLLRGIMQEFDAKTERSYDRSLHNFNRYLLECYRAEKIPVLLIDEAQNLVRDSLKLIHYLLNFETDTEKLLQIVLVGQDELVTKILKYRELASRMFPIAMSGLSREDLELMIQFRWMVAGGSQVPFETSAFDAIFAYSRGLPRDAVKICDESLRYAVAKDHDQLTAAEIDKVAASLNLRN